MSDSDLILQPLEGIKRFFFTFGSAHIHYFKELTVDSNCILVIYAYNMADARNTMCNLFGDRWAFSYEEFQIAYDFIQHFPRGFVYL